MDWACGPSNGVIRHRTAPLQAGSRVLPWRSGVGSQLVDGCNGSPGGIRGNVYSINRKAGWRAARNITKGRQMLERRLFFTLVLILAILLILTLVFNWPPRLPDLLPNFTAELAGILVTLLLVDWILTRREAERWRMADVQIKADFASVALRFLARTTIFLTEAGWNAPEPEQPTDRTKPWSFVLEHITLAEVQSTVMRAGHDKMAAFAEGIHECLAELVQQHTRFSTRLSAGDTETILEFENRLKGLENELSLLGDDSSLIDLLDDDASSQELEDLTSRHLQKVSAELHDAITHSLAVFARPFSTSK